MWGNYIDPFAHEIITKFITGNMCYSCIVKVTQISKSPLKLTVMLFFLL